MDKSSLLRLRRLILQILYDSFQAHPYLQLEPDQLMASCHVDAHQLNWNLVYLEKCGYVELSKAYAQLPFVASAVTITVAGIDLLEDPAAFEQRFS